MRKTFFMILAVLFGQMVMADNNIHLVKDTPGLDPDDEPRSITEVTASINSQVLTVSFSELTASQIVITDSANLTVFNQNYAPANSIQSNLSTLPSGSYILNVYALGYWWYGYFNL